MDFSISYNSTLLFCLKMDCSGFHSTCLGSQYKISGNLSCLYNRCQHSMESVHLRKVELFQIGRVAVSNSPELTGSFYGEVNQAAIGRTEVTIFVYHFHSDVGEVFSIGCQLVAVADQFDMMRFSGSAYCLFRYCFSVLIVGYNFYFARFVYGIHPH